MNLIFIYIPKTYIYLLRGAFYIKISNHSTWIDTRQWDDSFKYKTDDAISYSKLSICFSSYQINRMFFPWPLKLIWFVLWSHFWSLTWNCTICPSTHSTVENAGLCAIPPENYTPATGPLHLTFPLPGVLFLMVHSGFILFSIQI